MISSISTGVASGGVNGLVSSSKGATNSSSTPSNMNSPTSDWELELSQVLGALGQYQYNWAQNQFAKTSAVTDEQINNYLSTAQVGSSMANNLLGRYENIFQPLEDQYVQEAGSYASDARKKFNMGAAQSASEQASTQGLDAATQKLQSYGIDPSSGRYADLVTSQKTAAAAAAAGAGQQAELATEQTGRAMREKAIAMGQQIPGQTVNALNSAYQGIAGAENAALGNASVGATLTDSANPFFSTAMGAKLPPVGNTSQSSGSTASQSAGGGGGGGAGQVKEDSAPPGSSNNGGGGGSGRFGGFGGGQSTPYSNSGNVNSGSYKPGLIENPEMPYQYDPNSDTSNDYNTPLPDNSGFGDYSQPEQTNWDTGSDQSYAPSDYGAYGGYAQGGGVLPGGNMGGMLPSGNMAGGGHVPASMSPSGGQQTDDIPGVIPQTGGQARLNADEFVIPKDVAMWKGQEFFQKLIEGSRKARMGAPAKPSQGPSQSAQPQMGAQ